MVKVYGEEIFRELEEDIKIEIVIFKYVFIWNYNKENLLLKIY